MQEALRFLSPGAEPVDRADFVEQARLLRRGSEASSRGLSLTIRGLRKSFGDNEVLRGIDLHIPAGQSVAIVGRSGCGKSTLLRLIAGLETITAGTISLGEDARPEDVRVMFQEPRLLPWARVLSNVEVGLGRERASADAQARAESALVEVGLADKRTQWPAVLSGGQKQRVALARALVSRPRVLRSTNARRAGCVDADFEAGCSNGSGTIRALPDPGDARRRRGRGLADRVLVIEDGRTPRISASMFRVRGSAGRPAGRRWKARS